MNHNWTKLLYKSEIVKAIFGEDIPQLTKVTVSKLMLDYNGTEAKITILLNDFPKNPPKKWLQSAYNALSMEMSLVVLEEIQINRWTRNNLVDLLIEQKNNMIYLRGIGDADFILAGKFLQVSNILPYQTTKMQDITDEN